MRRDPQLKPRIKSAERDLRRDMARIAEEPPVRSVLEEIGNAVSHGVGAGLSIAALVLMILSSDTGLKLMASLFYGISLFLLFLMSCLYHSFKKGSTVKRLWRRFDYSSIYLLIGGTTAPFYLVYWGDVKGIVIFCVQWALIITGVTFIGVFGPGRLRALHFTLYFLIGWSAVIFIPDWLRNDPAIFWMCLAGGVVYSVGMIPFIKDTRGAHFIWHLFVLAGAAVHWFAVYLLVL
ncbi:hemolysin III [Ruminococcaceae bacterium YRB3002]|nr:hemolysin III [Ruminococcaceae bacterium YRB3002]